VGACAERTSRRPLREGLSPWFLVPRLRGWATPTTAKKRPPHPRGGRCFVGRSGQFQRPQHPRSNLRAGALTYAVALCLRYASLRLDELGGPDQLGGDGPSLGGREGPALLARPVRVPQVQGETVVVLGDADPERRGRLRLPRAEPRAVLGVQVGVAPAEVRHGGHSCPLACPTRCKDLDGILLRLVGCEVVTELLVVAQVDGDVASSVAMLACM
jgi:hypothetical protein